MKFNLNDDQLIEVQGADAFAGHLESLQYEQFAILAQGEHRYVQVYLHEDGQYQLEYRDGSADAHFEAVGEITLADVQQAFLRYHSSAADWQQQWKWDPVSFEGNGE